MKRISLFLVIVFLLTSITTGFAVENEMSTWAKPYIEDIKTQNIYDLSIYKDYKDNITRGEFAYLAVRLYERFTGKEVEIGNASFLDTDDEWVLRAKNIQIINGYTDNSFRPNNPIRRDELAVLFVNLFDKINSSYLNESNQRFSDDNEIAYWAKESVYIAKANKVIDGVGNNKYDPAGYVTKEQSLTMISRVLNSEYIKPGSKFNSIEVEMLYSSTNTEPEYKTIKFEDHNQYLPYDYSNIDLSAYVDELKKVNIHNNDRYPSNEYLPNWFNPLKILNWGREPVLNINKIHARGITGKNVNIAYIDQPLKISHESLKDKNIFYDYVKTEEQYNPYKSMHGIAVTDIIFMTVPEVSLYYIGHPTFFADQKTHSEGIYKILEINKTLSEKDKIKVIGFSDNPDDREKNIEAFKKAVEEANRQGVVIFFADNDRLYIEPYLDRSNPENYKSSSSWDNPDRIHFPTTYTTANTVENNHYSYWQSAGTSWTTPMVVGLSAMALQIDPYIDPFKLYDYMIESAYDTNGLKIINPEGFIKLIEEQKKGKSYYNIVYNSEETANEDLIAIKEYSETLKDDNTIVNLIDVKSINNPIDIYNEMKRFHKTSNYELKGIQIFGTYDEVKAFEIHDKVDMGKHGIHDLGNIVTDHFYGNFNNDPSIINTDISMKKIFDERINIDFNLEWDLARLPLKKSEVANFLIKYIDYKSKIDKEKLSLINFSSPIFSNNIHVDNFGYFIKERLDKEFNIISENQYRLYGNTMGYYPINTDVLGHFNKENLILENKKDISNFVINSHGQAGNIDGVYYSNSDNESETRVSLVNNSNINDILSYNYYNLFLWNCWGASNLGDFNITSKILQEGKAINVIASSYITSNNGIDVYANASDILGNNGISIFYSTMKGIYRDDYSWSRSFRIAKNKYILNSLKDKSLKKGNYQFNLNNSLAFHYFGLIENPNSDLIADIAIIKNPEKDIIEDNNKFSYELEDDGSTEYKSISYSTRFEGTEIRIDTVEGAVSTNNVYIKIKYNSEINDNATVFLQGDEPGLKEHLDDATITGSNTIILKFDKQELLTYNAGLAVNLGNRNFVFIEKEISDLLASK